MTGNLILSGRSTQRKTEKTHRHGVNKHTHVHTHGQIHRKMHYKQIVTVWRRSVQIRQRMVFLCGGGKRKNKTKRHVHKLLHKKHLRTKHFRIKHLSHRTDNRSNKWKGETTTGKTKSREKEETTGWVKRNQQRQCHTKKQRREGRSGLFNTWTLRGIRERLSHRKK